MNKKIKQHKMYTCLLMKGGRLKAKTGVMNTQVFVSPTTDFYQIFVTKAKFVIKSNSNKHFI